MAFGDLAFLIRISDKMVLDRRANRSNAPAFPNGYIVPAGQQIIYGDSATDLGVVPNAFTWNGDNPPTFSPVPDVVPGEERPPATTAERLASAEMKLEDAKAEILAIRADMGIG